jgi:dienelactone hydrolase
MLICAGAIVSYAQEPLDPPGPYEFAPRRLRAEGEFYSEYETTYASARPSGSPGNDVVRLRVFLPTTEDGPVPFVVLLHYWGATDLNLEYAWARRLAEAGIGCGVIALPYHIERTPAGLRSGEAAVVPDSARLRETMAQSVADVRRALDWADTRPELDRSRYGVAGTSLGALVGALCFGVDRRLAAGVFVLGGADLAHVFWNSSRTVSLRDAMRSRGYTEDRLREELAGIEPATWLRQSPERPALVVTAKFDTVVPAASARALLDALPSAQTITLETGHYGGSLVQNAILRNATEFFARTFRGDSYRAPSRLYAPTLRVGLALASERGLQVAVGVDLWRSPRDGRFFGSVLVTPQGVQGFLGTNLGNGLAAGAMVLPKRTSPGLFWNVVL